MTHCQFVCQLRRKRGLGIFGEKESHECGVAEEFLGEGDEGAEVRVAAVENLGDGLLGSVGSLG